MKRFFFVVLMFYCYALLLAKDGWSYVKNPGALKVLHLSFHLGCIKDFEEVARELKLDLTSWYILGKRPLDHFDGYSKGNEIYNINHERAKRVWERHKDFFDEFDVIFTSDTAPLSRIFLQNGWKKPLVIWICNRFDYADGSDHSFPDAEYYRLFQQAASMPNVRIIPYTDYEWYYAEQKGLNIGRKTIRPLGSMDDSFRFGSKSLIPDHIDPESTIFIYPRLDGNQMAYTKYMCQNLDIPYYTGHYNGPGELAKYKGVLYFPYAWSNIALYENLQRGIIHFVPTPRLILKLIRQGHPIRTFTKNLFHLGEWYKPEYKDVIVYFDSWQEFEEKFLMLDYKDMQVKVRAFGQKHRTEVLSKWQQIFDEMRHYLQVFIK